MSLTTPPSVRELQRALYVKAKAKPAYRSVDSHVRSRLRRWLSKKHQLNNSGQKGFRDQYLKQNLGLFCLAGSTNNLPWANA